MMRELAVWADTGFVAPVAPMAIGGYGTRESLALVERHLVFTRRRFHTGDVVQLAGDAFTCLHIIKVGAVKTVTRMANGHEQVAGLYLQGDWIGFDCIASGRCASDAYAMDTSEIWSLPYAALLKVAATVPALLASLYMAMSCQLARDREWRFALGSLSADARVADFVRSWAGLLAERQLRTDQITLRLTRAEIGSYLGMTLETVSRAFSRLVRSGLLRFEDKGHRQFSIPSLAALTHFVDNAAPSTTSRNTSCTLEPHHRLSSMATSALTSRRTS